MKRPATGEDHFLFISVQEFQHCASMSTTCEHVANVKAEDGMKHGDSHADRRSAIGGSLRRDRGVMPLHSVWHVLVHLYES